MKEVLECKREKDNLRNFLLTLFYTYKNAREDMGIPLNDNTLKDLLENIDIVFYELEDEKMTGTFKVNHNTIYVIKDNFDKNSSDRNIFLLLHELTHLSSELNNECFGNTNSMSNWCI